MIVAATASRSGFVPVVSTSTTTITAAAVKMACGARRGSAAPIMSLPLSSGVPAGRAAAVRATESYAAATSAGSWVGVPPSGDEALIAASPPRGR